MSRKYRQKNSKPAAKKRKEMAEALDAGIDKENESVNSVQQNNTPKVVHETVDVVRYNRFQRKHGSFVIQNNENARFIKFDVDLVKNVTKVRDVQLSKASAFSFRDVLKAIDNIRLNEPKMNIGYMMIIKQNGERVTV